MTLPQDIRYDESNIITIHCKVLQIEECQYSTIIVEDLNREYTDDYKYLTIIKLPNWNYIPIEEGDVGYIQFEYVKGGETQWFNKSTQDIEIYKYTNNYFINFFKRDE